MLSESKFYMGYSRWDDASGGYETWEDSVSRVMEMHREKYADRLDSDLRMVIGEAERAYKNQWVLGAQRALQFGGEQLRKHEARVYNCSVSHCNRPTFFQETMYLLLCGCGVGFSVQQHHIDQLPLLRRRPPKRIRVFEIPDSIEGWADSFGVLLSSYLPEESAPFPEYSGSRVHFDFTKIRPKGSMISGGFKAPGPDGLRKSLEKCEALLEREIAGKRETAISPITAYDLVMHMSDAVLSGGVRRSATICLFDKDDEQMLKAKTGDWFTTNPQRARSNNSVMLIRDQLTRDEWAKIMKSVVEFGEPGFIFTESTEFAYNPCVEIGMLPTCSETGESGFQFCNLTEINGGKCVSKEHFFAACRAAAILGTLQAGYTNFTYLSEATKRITEREALIGVSITGWMNNPNILFDEEILREGARIVKQVNREVAELIGIRPAARTTCAKPSGNASVILGTASGIHGEHAPMYFRNVQMNDQDEVTHLIQDVNPAMVERSVWSANGTDVVVSFPVVSKPGSIYKQDLLGVKQLEFVKKAQQTWVEEGTNVELCVDPRLRHNISNTITIDDAAEIEQYLFDNREWFAGVSLLAASGDKAYAQAPFTEVFTADQLVIKYGEAAMFASGLVVDALHAFNQNLWQACSTAMGFGDKLGEDSSSLLKRDWVRRFVQYSNNYFDGDYERTTFCLKDIYNLHKWAKINRELKPIDFASTLSKKTYVDADTLASQGCAGGVCEIVF